ncbi:MAG: UDP-N-acetylmuramate dehydrogenase, partial [Candidatus Omnitrophota bacterium]
MNKADMKYFKDLKGRFVSNVLMSRYTTMKTGGPGVLYHPSSVSDLASFLRISKLRGISCLAIGKGSNIIICDNGANTVFVKLSDLSFKKIDVRENRIICGAGVLLNKLCFVAEKSSLTGLEFLFGIPGTVGGALVQNAGAHGGVISDIVEEMRALDSTGAEKVLRKKDIIFSYRNSSLEKAFIVEAVLKLTKGVVSKINKRTDDYMRKRLQTQDYISPSAGCIFKNPQNCGKSAGMMIEACGFKGKQVGGAAVSTKHANFIV